MCVESESVRFFLTIGYAILLVVFPLSIIYIRKYV